VPPEQVVDLRQIDSPLCHPLALAVIKNLQSILVDMPGTPPGLPIAGSGQKNRIMMTDGGSRG
jgi:hypothetical protein